MDWKDKPHILRFLRKTSGAAAVEFALIASVLLLIVAGVLDFGHAWYMRQVITNASREGARYGITYQSHIQGSSSVRTAPSALNPSIHDYVLNNYLTTTGLPTDANPTITPSGGGYGTGTKGSALQVTVTARKTWFIVSTLVPGITNPTTLSATTVMLCE
jgi:Flp pilus assembly protein TadG